MSRSMTSTPSRFTSYAGTYYSAEAPEGWVLEHTDSERDPADGHHSLTTDSRTSSVASGYGND